MGNEKSGRNRGDRVEQQCPPRIAMVTFSEYPDDPRPRRAVEALLSEGMRVDLICLGDGQKPARERLGGLTITRLSVLHHRGGALTYIKQYSQFIAWAGAIMAMRSLRRPYHLVYVHNMPDALVVTALVPRLRGAKVVLDLHDPMPELMATIFGAEENSARVQLLRFVEKWSIARADVVITVNRACQRVFGNRSCPPDKVHVVMNSPDEKIFQLRHSRVAPVDIRREQFVLLYHGSIVERNGLDLAVEALAEIADRVPGCELRICGRKTPFFDTVMEQARKKGVQDRIRYRGPKRLEELVGEIEECDVGVIPNHANAFTRVNTPTRIFEYLAMGKPVVAPRMPGIEDYFKADELVFFDASNATDLARAIEHVSVSASTAVETVERGQRVYLRHTWQEERRKLLNIVSGLLGEQALECVEA